MCKLGGCREGRAAEGALPPHHNPGVQTLQLFHTPAFGLETALQSLQQVLPTGWGDPGRAQQGSTCSCWVLMV